MQKNFFYYFIYSPTIATKELFFILRSISFRVKTEDYSCSNSFFWTEKISDTSS
jgi:hypothetical protein